MNQHFAVAGEIEGVTMKKCREKNAREKCSMAAAAAVAAHVVHH